MKLQFNKFIFHGNILFTALLIAGAVIVGGAALLSPAGQQVASGVGQTAQAGAEVATATADAIKAETQMAHPVITDHLGREMSVTHPSSGMKYDPLMAFQKLLSVPAHQAAILAALLGMFNNLAQKRIEQQTIIAQALALQGRDPKDVTYLLNYANKTMRPLIGAGN